MNWREARDMLDGKGKRRGPQDSLKIARNTVLERGRSFNPALARAPVSNSQYPETAIGLRFHNTYVAVLTPRWTELNTGGWNTRSTRDRIEFVSGISVGNQSGKGWAVYLTRDDLPCYCLRHAEAGKPTGDPERAIVIRGDYAPGLDFHFTGEYEGTSDVNPSGKPIYEWIPCSTCKGSTLRAGIDYESGGHPFYDGIRVSADGKRIMKSQPHKPARVTPVITESGFDMASSYSRPRIYGGW
jgi:hypothetical protein